MSTLNYNQILPKKFILLDGQPYEVLESNIMKKQQRKPVNQSKLRNVISGNVLERSFQSSETAEEAELGSKKIIFIYARGDEYFFHEVGDKSNRFPLSKNLIGSKAKYLKEGVEVEAMTFLDPSSRDDKETIIDLKLPIKMEFKITEAPPNVKGGTAQGGDKLATIETGAKITVPMFVEEGDTIRVNTERGEYSERV